MFRLRNSASWLPLLLIPFAVSGCSSGSMTSATSAIFTSAALHGSIHGGQQPIAGATIGLYAASTTGYATASKSLLKTPVVSDSSGSFNISGDYACTAGQQLYLIGTGGNTGSGVNPNAAIMAALGDCSQLTSSTYIDANEVTTIASVFALAPFLSNATSLGTSSTNVAGMTRAFASVHKLSNIATGSAPGDLLPAGAVAPTAEIYTLADILAACINTAGDTGSGTPCHQLFSSVTPNGGTAPTDTIGAALAIAKNPTLNVASLYNLISGQSPFQPTLTAAPADWTLAINYTASFNKPATTTVDSNGNIWIANAGNDTVHVLSQAGAPVLGSPLSGNGLAAPAAVAIDVNGNAWLANSTGTSLSVFTSAGAPMTGSPFTPGGLINPMSLAFDATGDLWVANSGNNSVMELTGNGAAMGQTFSSAQPSAIAIDPK